MVDLIRVHGIFVLVIGQKDETTRVFLVEDNKGSNKLLVAPKHGLYHLRLILAILEFCCAPGLTYESSVQDTVLTIQSVISH